MKHIRSVIPAKKMAGVSWKKCLIWPGRVFENLKGGWQGWWNQMIIMPTNKYLDKNMLRKLARDNLFYNIRPEETYSIEISKKGKKINQSNFLEQNFHLGNRRKTNFFRFKIRPSTLSFCSLSSRSMFICTVQLSHFFIPWQLKIRRYMPVPKYNKFIVVFRSAESPVYVFQ